MSAPAEISEHWRNQSAPKKAEADETAARVFRAALS